MVSIVVDLVVVDGQEVAVVVGVEAVRGVVVHLVSPPVSLLVAVRVHSEMVVVDIRIVDVAVDVDLVEQLGIAQVLAKASHLTGRHDVGNVFYSDIWKCGRGTGPTHAAVREFSFATVAFQPPFVCEKYEYNPAASQVVGVR